MVVLMLILIYFCEENNVKMFFLWNDLVEILNSFDDIGYEVIFSMKIL